MEEPKESNANTKQPCSAFPVIESSSLVTIIWDPDNVTYPCIFCKQYTVDELKLGPLYRLPGDGVVAHYFCMLFSAGLVQQGDDRQGILGFLPEDILKEARRAQRLKCSYCHAKGASIGCNMSRCKVSFHFPCGLENEANFQFVRNYQAFCKNHSVLEEITIPASERNCPICLSLVELPERPVTSSCCKAAIFHKQCLQRLALNAGYFFKCPTCNSLEDFSDKTKIQGIFVPEQDASWEREPNAYEDLYQVYNKCDTEPCECPKGSTYGASKGSWLLARCRICGSRGTHRQCAKLTTIANWACDSCLKVEERTIKDKKYLSKLAVPQPSTSTARTHGQELNSKTTALQASTKKSSKNATTELRKTQLDTTLAKKTETLIPNKRAKRTGIPVGSFGLNDDDEDIDLTQIHIPASCRDYFPFNREAKKQFNREHGSFPDWRNYRLQVELVDVFVDVIDIVENPPEVTSPVSQQVLNPTSNGNEQIVRNTETLKGNKSRKTAGKKRGSSWSKGWVKRKKKPVVSKPKPSVKTALPEEINVEKTSSGSNGVLVGIRRSHESLLQLQAQASIKADDTKNIVDGTSTVPNGNGIGNKTQSTTESDGDNFAVNGSQSQRIGLPLKSCPEDVLQLLSNGVSKPSSSMRKSVEETQLMDTSGPDSQIRSQSVNGASDSQTSIKSHPPVIKTEVNGIESKSEDSSRASPVPTSSQSSVNNLRKSAENIARHIRNLSEEEADAQLRILEMNLPQIFNRAGTTHNTS